MPITEWQRQERRMVAVTVDLVKGSLAVADVPHDIVGLDVGGDIYARYLQLDALTGLEQMGHGAELRGVFADLPRFDRNGLGVVMGDRRKIICS